MEPSTWKQGRHDQPQESTRWLKAFKTVNQKFLEQVLGNCTVDVSKAHFIPDGSLLTSKLKLQKKTMK